MIPASEPRASDSSPASVEESAAADQQRHEDDDEQSIRVHVLSRMFGKRGPASSRPTETLVTNDGDSAPRDKDHANSNVKPSKGPG
jgi:hypothetical protein